MDFFTQVGHSHRGDAANDRPISARIIRIPCQLVIMVDNNVQQEANNKAVTITGLRPIASESGPVKSKPIASMAVEIESETLLLAGRRQTQESTGSIG